MVQDLPFLYYMPADLADIRGHSCNKDILTGGTFYKAGDVRYCIAWFLHCNGIKKMSTIKLLTFGQP